MPAVIDSASDVPSSPLSAWAAPMPRPSGVLLCPPDEFDVVDVKNAHMAQHVGGVDRDLARRQWDDLSDAFCATGLDVRTVAPTPGCEDMVFTANQTLTGIDAAGVPTALISRMRHASRRREVPAIAAWFEAAGWRVADRLPTGVTFEGGGDVVWHPGRRLAWAGHGFRSDPAAHAVVADVFDVPVLSLRLVDERFYHLDTCLCPLGERAALAVVEAFDDGGRALLHAVFDEVIPCDPDEAASALAGNAVVHDGHVIIDRRAARTASALEARGHRVHRVDTGEFLKSGGSVFCLKQWLWSPPA